jgi:hypothetical protein
VQDRGIAATRDEEIAIFASDSAPPTPWKCRIGLPRNKLAD